MDRPVDEDRENDPLDAVTVPEKDKLDETVLGAPAVGRGTEGLTEWDEQAETFGTWTPRDGRDDGMLEADRERREASGET